jgi:hypothetical protein
VVFGRNTARTGPFPPSLDLSTLDGTNGFRLNGVRAHDRSGDVNSDGFTDLLIGAEGADPNGESSGGSYVVFGGPPPPLAPPAPRTCNGLPVTIQGTDNGETLNGTCGNDVIDGQGGTTCSAAEAAVMSSAAVTAGIGSSGARAATGCSAAQAATRCAASRAEMR